MSQLLNSVIVVDNIYTNEYGGALSFLSLDAEILFCEIFMCWEVLLLIF